MYDPATAVHGVDAVAEALPDGSGHKAALSAVKDLARDAKYDRGELTITVTREDVIAAALLIKGAGYNFLMDVTSVDWYPSEPRFQVTYHILSHSYKAAVRMIVLLNSSDAAIDTMTTVWPSANFYEREIFDLMGVHFGGHPNLVRIMMPTDWQGHPLRKDYPVEGYR